MSATDPDRAQRLDRIGVTEADLAALETIWNRRAFGLIADERTAVLADWGYSPLDSLDAIWHELDHSSAHLYMQHGLTPHQAFLLDTNSRAQANLWGAGDDLDPVHELLAAPLPSDTLVNILLVASTPDETRALIDSCGSSTTSDAEAAVAGVNARAELLTEQTGICNC